MTLISNESVFDEEFIPQILIKRKKQIDQITSYLKPITLGRKAPNLLLHGSPGTGKTVTGKFILKKFSRKVRTCYINCSIHRSLHSVLDHMISQLRVLGGFQQSVNAKLKALEKHLSQPMIIMLDEIDWPSPKDRDTILYNFLKFPAVSLMLICASRYSVLEMDRRVISRLNLLPVEFPPYSEDDLFRILRQRAKLGLSPEAWDEDLIRKVVGMTDSDVRVAIKTLYNAAVTAETMKSEKILPEHISRGLVRAKELERKYKIEKLGVYPKMIYRIVDKVGLISSSNLFKECLKRCRELNIPPMPRRSYFYHINNLLRDRLIEAEDYGERYFRVRR